jgi:hypothetical protein
VAAEKVILRLSFFDVLPLRWYPLLDEAHGGGAALRFLRREVMDKARR